MGPVEDYIEKIERTYVKERRADDTLIKVGDYKITLKNYAGRGRPRDVSKEKVLASALVELTRLPFRKIAVRLGVSLDAVKTWSSRDDGTFNELRARHFRMFKSEFIEGYMKAVKSFENARREGSDEGTIEGRRLLEHFGADLPILDGNLYAACLEELEERRIHASNELFRLKRAREKAREELAELVVAIFFLTFFRYRREGKALDEEAQAARAAECAHTFQDYLNTLLDEGDIQPHEKRLLRELSDVVISGVKAKSRKRILDQLNGDK